MTTIKKELEKGMSASYSWGCNSEYELALRDGMERIFEWFIKQREFISRNAGERSREVQFEINIQHMADKDQDYEITD